MDLARTLPRWSRSALIAAMAAALVAGSGISARADASLTNQANPSAPPGAVADEHYRQQTGERILGLPDEPTCTVVMTKNYPMANTAYGPDKPYEGKFKPGDCVGPWTRIIAHVHTNVTGVQFDRIAWINLGGRRIVTFSSQEPRGDGAGQVVQDETYDVTRYASLFTSGQPVEFNVANVVTGPYNGIFYSDLSFEFYDDSAAPLPVPAPEVVTAIPASTLLADPVTQKFTIPANTTELAAELYVKASGGCDEFWWAAAPAPYPGQCDAYPILEIDVLIDDVPAALVNTYPALFTGANGPSWWHPIPAPRAYDLRPYTVDLSPFIGNLTDGKKHSITYQIPERRWTDGNDVTVWSNLLLMRNPDSTDRTTGSVKIAGGPPLEIKDHGDDQSYTMSWKHHWSIQGTIHPAGHNDLVRHTSFTSNADTSGGATTNDDSYRWVHTSYRAGESEDPWYVRDLAKYRLVYRPDGWFLRDSSRSYRYDHSGELSDFARLHDRMHSDTAAGTPSNRRSTEFWNYSTDGPLGCGTTRLIGENPNIVKNKQTDDCHF